MEVLRSESVEVKGRGSDNGLFLLTGVTIIVDELAEIMVPLALRADVFGS